MPDTNNNEKSLFLQKLEEEQKLLDEKEEKNEVSLSESKNQKKKKGKKKKKKMPAVAIFTTVFLLFLVVVVLLIFTMSLGGVGNPVIRFFGQNEDTVKEFLINVVNGSFGFLSVILLLLIAITLFFGFSRPKSETQKRSISFLFSFVSIGLQFVTIIAWLGMYNFVSALQAQVSEKKGEILLSILEKGEKRLIQPAETLNMVVPVVIGFSAENITRDIEADAVESYSWDFEGDGMFETEVFDTIVERRIQRYGAHEVSVKVLLSDGSEIIKTIRFQIPQGTFMASPETGPIPLEVTFDATSISAPFRGSVAQYEWDFDNDYEYEETTKGPIALHTFKKIGTYAINLRVVNQNQTLQTYVKQITTTRKLADSIRPVIKTKPEMINISQKRLSIVKDETVTFNASDSWSSDGEILSYEWSFSDVAYKKNGPVIARPFEKVGDAQVTLSLRDEAGNRVEETIYVTVAEIPNTPQILIKTDPEFEPRTESISGTVPLHISFDASDSLDADGDIVSYEWDFDGDGNMDQTGEKVEHTYNLVGTYEVSLAVRDKTGKMAEKKIPVEVLKHDLRAVIHADPENAFVPCIVNFDGSLSSCADCKIVAYEWDFGDGNSSNITAAKLTHPYDLVGVFPVTLKVHTNTETAETTKNIFCLETQVNACFVATKINGRAPLKTSFNPDCTAGTVINWKWDFGDNTSSNERLPTHVFKKSGTYETSLTVTDANGNTDTYTSEIRVE